MPKLVQRDPEEGSPCPDFFCTGRLTQYKDPNECCSCHLHPPCGYCTDPRFICTKCDILVVDDAQTR